MSLFWLQHQAYQRNAVALSLDATTTPAVDSTNAAYSWTHTPSGTPSYVVVLIAQNAASGADSVSGVTYGGVAMTRVPTDGFAQDTASEPGAVYAYTLASPTAGAQTVTVTKTSAAIWMGAASYTLIGNGTPSITASASQDEDSTTMTAALDPGGLSGMAFAAVFSGHGVYAGNVVPTAATVVDNDLDAGSQVVAFGHSAPSTSSETIGWTQVFNDAAFVAVLITDPGGGGGGGGGTAADAYTDAVLALNLVAYYKLDESAGTTMTDSSPTANDGSYAGTPTLGVSGPMAGATGVTFDGLTQYGSASYAAALDFAATEDFSIVLWFKTSTWAVNDFLLGRSGNSDYNDYEVLTVTSGGDAVKNRFSNAAETVQLDAPSLGTTDLNDSAWHMLALAADRSALATWYLDGTAHGATDISGNQHILDTNAPLFLARRNSPTGFWAGSLAQVSIHDSLLSAADITTLWTAAGN